MKKILTSLFLTAFLTLSVFASNVRVVNYSSYPVVGVYATISSEQNWTSNLLGGVTIYKNQYFDITTNYYDYYDFAVYDSTGDSCVLRNVAMNRNRVLTVGTTGCVIR